MKNFYLIIVGLLVSIATIAGDIERISFTCDYISNNTNESPEQAEISAKKYAQVKALEGKFGLDIIGITETFTNETSTNGSYNTATTTRDISETSVQGEWIEITKEEILKKTYVNGFWHIRVCIEGRARRLAQAKTDIYYAFVNNAHDRQNRNQYYDGDDIFLKFSSPVSGSLCVYLVDEEDMAYCLLPYQNTTTGCHKIEANKEYMLFSEDTDYNADEYTLNCQRDVEHNTLYVIFTPKNMVKASDKNAGTNWLNQSLPRQLSVTDMMKWLAKNQSHDKEMVVHREMITISK